MTTKTFPKLILIPGQSPEQNNMSSGTMPAPPFTWEKLAGHWLRSPTVKADESDATTRRQTAVRRRRRLNPASTCCP
jgi:hypothetical protein